MFRQQTRDDFLRRVRRVDPKFYRWQRGMVNDTTVERPLASLFIGFGWAYLVISIANNRETIKGSLEQGALSAEQHTLIFMILAALLAMSGVALILHLFRYLFKSGGKKRNSGGLLLGTLGALMLVYTPPSVWRTGVDMLDANSRSLLLTASNTVEDAVGVDLSSVRFVTSSTPR